MEECIEEPDCTLVSSLYEQDLAELEVAPNPNEWLAQNGIDPADLGHACRPDIFQVLSKPCRGSRGDLLVRCGGHGTAGQCNLDSACIWLRNGWWYEAGSSQEAKADDLTAVQGGVPSAYACWPKWHVHDAAMSWPGIQFKTTADPLVCPVLAMDYPCTIYTYASLHNLTTGKSKTGPFDTKPSRYGVVTAADLDRLARGNSSGMLADMIGSSEQCINLSGMKGTCPHVRFAAWLVDKLARGWKVPAELFTSRTQRVASRCNPDSSVDASRTTNSSFYVAMPVVLHGGLNEWNSTDLHGSECMFDGSYFASYAAVHLPSQCRRIKYLGLQGGVCNNKPISARRAKDNCMAALASGGLWEAFAAAVLGGDAAAPQQSSFWLKRLPAAGQGCGTLEVWNASCPNVDPVRHAAYLDKLIADYVKLLLSSSGASEPAQSATYACKPEMVAAYKSLAVAWIIYAAILLLGLVGMATYWCTCIRKLRWLRAYHAAVAMRHMLASPHAAPQPQTGLRKLGVVVRWAMPRLRAMLFVGDVGLDVFTLVQLARSRWFLQLLVAIIVPYLVMALLVLPGFGKQGRSDYSSGVFPVCCCATCCWPAVMWLDVRMIFSLLGVPLPCCGDSRIVMSLYTDLRMFVEGFFEALPSAMVSTAVLYDKMGQQSAVYAIPTAVLWLNLVCSFIRGAVEVWHLAVLTHEQGNWCFLTTIVRTVWDMLPPTASSAVAPASATAGNGGGQCATTPAAQLCAAAAATVVAPRPLHMSLSIHRSTGEKREMAWVLCWVWLWMTIFIVLTVLLFVSIGCVGLLVQDGYINLYYFVLPRYRFAGDATCGAGSLFGALHSGSSASCTLPNLAIA